MPSYTLPDLSEFENLPIEEKYSLAVHTIQNAGIKSNGDGVLSLRKAAGHFGLEKRTLESRLKGAPNHLKTYGNILILS
jgi:hypothetical protein